jgi:predicted TIM-barrel fold metal-dependent hydrolase
MDANGIATAILSVSTPGVHFGDDAEAREKAREVNEFAAAIVRADRQRFGFFATLPLPDVQGALAEAAHSFDSLGADGVVLLANARGKYLGHIDIDPLFSELNRRNAVVFIHPSILVADALPGVPPFAVDFLLDTTRAALDLVRANVVQRYPNLKIILSHAGGFVPYAARRISLTVSMLTSRPVKDVLEDLRRFYFDTALSAPSALPSLLAFAKPGHVLFGSDWPYAPAPVAASITRELDSYAGLDAAGQSAIARESAIALFPRLATKVVAS